MPAHYLFVAKGSRSCGCLRNDVTSARLFKHGVGLKDYRYLLWTNLMRKCYRPESKDYKYYGARGIRVHEPWHDPATFMRDLDELLGPRPDGLTLDRIDNDGDYAPGNIRWATREQQARNRGNWAPPTPRGPGERGCSAEGCEIRHYALGLCRRHYRQGRWKEHGYSS